MIPNLKALINQVGNGVEDALWIRPTTLRDILWELQGMCQGDDGIRCDPIPGFTGYRIGIAPDHLFYYVQNGALAAGYFPMKEEPNAPGL